MNRKKTVFVGLSGGVDSSVAALRLLRADYNVVGVFIKVWHPEWLVCNWEQERLDAMRVAAKLGIPFLTCDAEAAYRDDVAAYFIEEYKAGRTPNPDVMCNKYVKFGAFLSFAKAHGADFIATGHYAQRIDRNNQPELHRGVDSSKDQSYFLWTLGIPELTATLFPVGNSPKAVIRKEAAAVGLLTAEKKDSQGICFLGHIDIKEFLSHYTTLVAGAVLTETGAVIGTHDGALMYTIGQRHGFTITDKNAAREIFYIIDRDLTKNTITVRHEKPTVTNTGVLTLRDINLLRDINQNDHVTIQNRYRQKPIAATIVACTETTLSLKFDETADAPATGQSCVLYDGMRMLGGGIIAKWQ